MRKILVILLISFIASGNIQAEERQFKAVADRESYHVGDIISLKLELKGRGYRLDRISDELLAPFELAGKEESYDAESDSSSFILKGRIFEVGEFTIPSLAIIDGEGNRIEGEPAIITIEPILKADEDQIREIKPQVGVDESGPLWPWMIVVLILLAFAALLFYIFRKKKAEVNEEPLRAIPPHIAALDELLRIEGMNLIRDGRIKELYTAVGDVLRGFEGRLSSFDAMEMTTGELLDALAARGKGDLADLGRFLGECDMVKFAKHSPAAMDIEGLIERARSIINKDSPPEGDLKGSAAGEEEIKA